MPSRSNSINKALSTDKNAAWLQKANSPFDMLDEEWWQIFKFYVFYAPVKGVSARGKVLKGYKWGEKSRKHDFKLLIKRIIKFSDMDERKFLYAQKWDELKELYTSVNLAVFPAATQIERLVFRNDKAGVNESLFNHIRNAIAHGRIAIYDHDGDMYAAMEDINSDDWVSARMILKKKTLLSWIKVIKAGPFVSEDALNEIILNTPKSYKS